MFAVGLLRHIEDMTSRATNENVGVREGPFASIEAAIAAVKDGKIVIVVDDEDRENEGDLTVAAEKITPEVINFMARHGRGLICMPMTGERLEQLEVPLMVNENTATYGTAFCVSIEGKKLSLIHI